MSEELEPVTGIFPDEGTAREAQRRLAEEDAQVHVQLFSPSCGSRHLRALARQARRDPWGAPPLVPGLLAGAGVGALAEGVLLLLGVDSGAGYLLEAGTMTGLGALAGAAAASYWQRRLSLPPSLQPVHQALRHGHWVVVALPRTQREYREASRVFAQDPRGVHA